MPCLLPFEPPNEHVCIALYHPERNAWWIVMNTHRWEERDPWEKAIQHSNGTLISHQIAAWYARSPHSWPSLQTNVREQMKNGFTIAVGGLDQVQASGTRWLRSDPTLWWHMHSASVAQLEVIKNLANCADYVLGALARQGHFGFKQGTSGHKGPSFVEKRWRTVFPAEIAFADQCQSLGIGTHEALALWKSAHMHNNILIESPALGDFLGVPDLR